MSDQNPTFPPRIVVTRAPWRVTEVVPILLFVGLAVAAVVGTVVNASFPAAAGYTAAGVLIGLAAWIFFISRNRKKNSTMHAILNAGDDRLLDVWMTKPMQDKWGGRLDKGRNKAPLGSASRVEYKLYGKTPAFLFTSASGKMVTVPQRLLEQPEVYVFVKEAVEALPPLRFKDTDSAEQFAGYIGTGRLNPVDVAPIVIVHPNAEAEAALQNRPVKKKDAKKAETEVTPAPDDEPLAVIVEEVEVKAPAETTSQKPVTVLDYSALRVTVATTLSEGENMPALLVAGLPSHLDEPTGELVDEGREDTEDSGWSAGSLLLGGGVSSETLPAEGSQSQK